MTFLEDTNFWVLLSFIIFIGVFIKYGLASALAKLDGHIHSIKTELETAENLRIEAQELIAEYRRKHQDAMNEAASIIARAKDHADAMRAEAEEDLKQTMKRREDQLNDKLKRIEQNAIQDIQVYTAQIAINATKALLADKMNIEADKAIISNALENIPKSLN